jgi:hypothetical protein
MHLPLLYKIHIDGRDFEFSFLTNIGFLDLVTVHFLYQSSNMISVRQIVLPYNVMNKIETLLEMVL